MANADRSDQWADLPDHVIVSIFGYLSMGDASKAALTCRRWHCAFDQPRLWRRVQFSFCRGLYDEKYLNALHKYGEHFGNVVLNVDQGDEENRRLAVKLLTLLGELRAGRMQRLRVCFTGTNPLFYGGQEFVLALGRVFQCAAHSLQVVHLSQAPVMYTEDLFLSLSSNHGATLRYLNIQTKQFICKVGPECLLTVAQACRRLVDLRVCHSSLSCPVLAAFAEQHPHREPLRHLSILCRRQEKYFHHDLTQDAWEDLMGQCPRLEVTLKFDPTCPLEKAREIMKAGVPVRHLFMEMYTNAHEIALAVEHYHPTLTKLVVQARPSPLLEDALLDAARWCPRLRALHVMCLLEETTVQEILGTRPELTSTTLKHTLDPHPWVTDEVLDELPDYVSVIHSVITHCHSVLPHSGGKALKIKW